jgi:hypothetical protein
MRLNGSTLSGCELDDFFLHLFEANELSYALLLAHRYNYAGRRLTKTYLFAMM